MTLPPAISAFLKKFRGAGGTKHLNPSRDWLLLIAVGFAALIGSVAWNTWFFFVALDEDAPADAIPVAEAPATNSLQKAQALFETKAAELERYRTEYRFIDPSR